VEMILDVDRHRFRVRYTIAFPVGTACNLL
jgi:hypothetical protein